MLCFGLDANSADFETAEAFGEAALRSASTSSCWAFLRFFASRACSDANGSVHRL